MNRPLILASAVLALLGFAGLAQAAPLTLSPGAFSRVQACVPFAVKFKPGSSHSVQVDAEPAVQRAFKATVDASGTLKLGSVGSFTTRQPIKVTVTAPAEALEGVTTVADAVLAPGFSPNRLTLSSVGSGSLLVKGLETPSLEIATSG
jgi:hypothetical protein